MHVIAPPPHYPSGRLATEHRSQHRVGTSTVGAHGATVHRVAWWPHDGGIVRRTLDHSRAATATARRALILIRSGAFVPDVIVATAPALETLVAGVAVSRRTGIPLISEMRDAWPDLVSYTPGMTGGGPIGTVKALVHRFTTRLQGTAAHVVTTTEAFADVLRERGIDAVTVIRNGSDVDAYRTVRRTGGDGRLRVLYLGTVGRSQGLDLVVRVAARLRQDGAPVDVRIVGAGADVRRLRTLDRQLDAGVDLRGAVPPSEVAEHDAWADSIIVSLRDWEPFAWTVPSKLYEALATGKHVTAILAGEAADIVRSTGAGDVVAPGDDDALADTWRALAADEERLVVGDGGWRWATEHASFDRLAARYLEVVDAVGAEAGDDSGQVAAAS